MGAVNVSTQLGKDEILRYSRHLIMPEVGMEGQLKLKQAKVLCVGTGGLGSPAAMYLAAAGVGTLGIVDFDVVDFTNLQRQLLHGTSDVGRSKIASACDTLREINPHVEVVSHETRLDSSNAMDIAKDYDVVVDGTDNFPTRYLMNDACMLLGKPNVYGSVFRMEGQASVFYAKEGPCYRCLYPEPPPPGVVPSCAEGGVMGVLPGIIGCIQALETIKLITGKGKPLIGRLLLFDALNLRFRELKLRKNVDCPVCGPQPTITELIDYDEFCGYRPEDREVPADIPEVAPTEVKKWLDERKRLVLLDVREPHEHEICHLHGARLIPLGDLVKRMHELDSADDIVVYCRWGQRSAKAVALLMKAGFRKIHNLQGGLLAWAEQVDPSMPRY